MASNPLDRATAFLPGLLHERMDEIGLDFSVLYTSVGLACFNHPDDEVRRGSCRALNTYLAEMCHGLDDRLTPAAVIPAHTPDEAVAELEHAVVELGLKAAVVNCCVVADRAVGAAPGSTCWPSTARTTTTRCGSASPSSGVAVTAHSPTMGLDLRQSSSRYMFNHIGTFAAGSEAVAKALVFGGVAAPLPEISTSASSSAAWRGACSSSSTWWVGGRSGAAPPSLGSTREPSIPPSGTGSSTATAVSASPTPSSGRSMLAQSDNPPPDLDDFRDSGVTDPSDLVALFDRFYFGCEADEGTIGWAFDADDQPARRRAADRCSAPTSATGTSPTCGVCSGRPTSW